MLTKATCVELLASKKITRLIMIGCSSMSGTQAKRCPRPAPRISLCSIRRRTLKCIPWQLRIGFCLSRMLQVYKAGALSTTHRTYVFGVFCNIWCRCLGRRPTISSGLSFDTAFEDLAPLRLVWHFRAHMMICEKMQEMLGAYRFHIACWLKFAQEPYDAGRPYRQDQCPWC